MAEKPKKDKVVAAFHKYDSNKDGYTQYFLNGTVLHDQLVCPLVSPLFLIVFGP